MHELVNDGQFTIRHDIYLCTLKSSRYGQLSLAHGTETKNAIKAHCRVRAC